MPRASLILAAWLLAAPAVAAPPRAEVSLAFERVLRHGMPMAVRVRLEGGSAPWQGSLRIREAGRAGSLTWELPIELPAGARQERWFTIAPALASAPSYTGLRWSIDGVPPSDLDEDVWWEQPTEPRLLVACIGSRPPVGPAVRAAFDPKGQSIVKPVQLSVADCPPSAAAWEMVDVVFVEASTLATLPAPVLRALADRTLLGGTLVIHGPERVPEHAPPTLRFDSAERASSWTEPASGVDLPALEMSHAGQHLIAVEGDRLRWVTTRNAGGGLVVRAGVALGDLRGSVPEQAALLRALVRLRKGEGVNTLAERGRGSVSLASTLASHAAVRSNYSTRMLRGVALALTVLLVAAIVAVQLVRRRPALRARAHVLCPAACAVAALPFLVGGACVRLMPDGAGFVLEEVFEGDSRRRVTALVELQPGDHGRELPSWPVRPSPVGDVAGGALGADARFVAGAPPRLENALVASMNRVHVQCDAWGDAPALPRLVSRRPPLLEVPEGQDYDQAVLLLGGSIHHFGAVSAGRHASQSPAQLRGGEAALAALRELRARGRGPALALVRGATLERLRGRATDRLVILHLPRSAP